jgi:hypothetical protein
VHGSTKDIVLSMIYPRGWLCKHMYEITKRKGLDPCEGLEVNSRGGICDVCEHNESFQCTEEKAEGRDREGRSE